MANISNDINVKFGIDVAANLDRAKTLLNFFKDVEKELKDTGKASGKVEGDLASVISKTQVFVGMFSSMAKPMGWLSEPINSLKSMSTLLSEIEKKIKKMPALSGGEGIVSSIKVPLIQKVQEERNKFKQSVSNEIVKRATPIPPTVFPPLPGDDEESRRKQAEDLKVDIEQRSKTSEIVRSQLLEKANRQKRLFAAKQKEKIKSVVLPEDLEYKEPKDSPEIPSAIFSNVQKIVPGRIKKTTVDLLADQKKDLIQFYSMMNEFGSISSKLSKKKVPGSEFSHITKAIHELMKGLQSGKIDIKDWEGSMSALDNKVKQLRTSLVELENLAKSKGIDDLGHSFDNMHKMADMAENSIKKLKQQKSVQDAGDKAKDLDEATKKSIERYNKKSERQNGKKNSVDEYQEYLNDYAKESDYYYSDLRKEGINQRKKKIAEQEAKKKKENAEYEKYISQQGIESERYYGQLYTEGTIQNAHKMSGFDSFIEKQVSAVGRLARYYASFEVLNKSMNAVSASMQEAVMVQDKMLEVKKFLPINAATKELENNVYALAKAYGVSTETVLNSYSEFAQQGFKANQILDATKAALLGVNVASIDFADSTKFLTTATNVWNYNLSQSTMLFDKLSKVQAVSAVTSQAMISGIQKTGSIAHDVGVSMDELLGYIAAITEKTQQSGEVTGNALKTMLERLLRSDSIRKLEALDPLKGITFRNIQTGELEKAGVILSQIAGKWQSLTDIERKSIGEIIAGGRQINTFTALMSNFDSAVRLSGESLNSFGFAQQQNQTEMQKFSKNAQILQNVFLEFTTSALAPFVMGTNLGMKALSVFGDTGMEVAKIAMPGLILGISSLALTHLPNLISITSKGTGTIASFAKAFVELNSGIAMSNLVGFMSTFGPYIIGAAVAIGTLTAAFQLFNSQQQEAREKAEASTKAINDLADSLIKLGKNVSLSDINKELEKLTAENITALPERIQNMLVFKEGRAQLAKGVDPNMARRAIFGEKIYAPTEKEGARPIDVLRQLGIDKDTELTIDKVRIAYEKLQNQINAIKSTGIPVGSSVEDAQKITNEFNRLTGIINEFKKMGGMKPDWLGNFSELTKGALTEATGYLSSLLNTQEQLKIKPTSESEEKLQLQKTIIEGIGVEMEKGLFTAQQKNKEFDVENELLENLKAQQFELGAKEIELRDQVNKGIEGSKEKYDEVIKKNEIVKALIGDQKDILQRLIALLNQDYFINIRFNIPTGIPIPSVLPLGGTSGTTLGGIQKTSEDAKKREQEAIKTGLDLEKQITEEKKTQNKYDVENARLDKKKAENVAVYSKNAVAAGNAQEKQFGLMTKLNEELKKMPKAEADKIKERLKAVDIQNEINLGIARTEKTAGGAEKKAGEDKAHLEALRKVHEIEAQIALEKQFQSYWEGKLEDSYLLRYDRETESLQIQIENNQKMILDSVKNLNEEDRNRYTEKIKELKTELDARKKNREEAVKINEEEKRAKAFKRSMDIAADKFSFRQEVQSVQFGASRYGITPEEQAAFGIQQQYEAIAFEKQKAQMIYQEKYRVTLEAIVEKQKQQKNFSMEAAEAEARRQVAASDEIKTTEEAIRKQQEKLDILYLQAKAQERQRAYAGVDEIKGVLSNLFESFNPITIYEQQKAKAKQMSDAYTEMAKAQSDANKAAQDVASAEATGNLDKINTAREKYTQSLNQIDEIKKKMQDINSETNKWADALKSIGNILFKKIADQVADIFIKKTGIAEMLAEAFLGISGLGQSKQSSAAGVVPGMVGMGGIGGLLMAPTMMSGLGGAGFGFGGTMGSTQNISQMVLLSRGMKQSGGGIGNIFSMMGGGRSSSGVGKWLNKPLDKWGGTGMGYLSSGLMGYGIGKAIGSKGGGALAGGLMGYLTAGPIGGLLGAIGGLFGGGSDDDTPAPPPVKEREFYNIQKNTDALDRNTAALMKLSEGVFNAPSTFEMPRLDSKSNITQSINVYVGAGSNSKAISSAVSEGVYKANMATFGTKTSNIVG